MKTSNAVFVYISMYYQDRRIYGTAIHGSARTTEAFRRAIQDSQESIAKLAERHTLKPKIVAKCKIGIMSAMRR